jgi:endonuclease/exonuclease/phosphatase family metal-dependent hydrolase
MTNVAPESHHHIVDCHRATPLLNNSAMFAQNKLTFAWVATFLLIASAALPADETPRVVRVLTYNIHHGEGTDRQFDLERLAAVIKSANPDLVGLQEVDEKTARSKGVDQAARLGELTGLRAIFGKAMAYQGGAYGLAMLSRWPVRESRTHPLPAVPGVEPRAVLEARLQIGESGSEIIFLVTHLDHRADPEQRMHQTAKLREIFPAAPNTTPALLVGDLNATPESAVLKALLADWTDSAAGQSFATSPAGAPRRKIDYILYRPSARWRVVETRALDEAIASDHRAVLTVFELRP